MYSTCLFCNKPLGANEVIEAFPVGRRLAFDQAKGRLWVVCPKCERWNLTPLEERWEAIEQSEKLYRDTRKRVATDNVGLAKLGDGTTLVRIGEPLRPEFAAWRYGDQFGRRRNRQILLTAGGLAGVGALFTGFAVAGVGMGAFAWAFANAGQSLVRGSPEEIIAKIPRRSGVALVRRRHLTESSLSRGSDGQLTLDLRFKNGSERFVGREAERIASIIIPKVNRFGGNKKAVADAVAEIESVGSAEGYIDYLSGVAQGYTRPAKRGKKYQRFFNESAWQKNDKGLFGLPGAHRLALEMALHEESERRAMHGELQELERAWRDAEEVASISDNLLVPSSVSNAVEKLRSAKRND
jgi:hypothetical protein